ncbi:hypothetical protein BDV96DRAFT_394851 [Lophiotrema nucula]|uniref:Uncharacterized protein n=1 Tax=Lophiotrema nucula TaxID=690887 RepID=A0A6A5ZE89_9PLEO|nr:hypothetical protein BDV96DRAFT_394851 [Lophiotrema nucula]
MRLLVLLLAAAALLLYGVQADETDTETDTTTTSSSDEEHEVAYALSFDPLFAVALKDVSNTTHNASQLTYLEGPYPMPFLGNYTSTSEQNLSRLYQRRSVSDILKAYIDDVGVTLAAGDYEEGKIVFATYVKPTFLNETVQDALWHAICPHAMSNGRSVSRISPGEAGAHAYELTECESWPSQEPKCDEATKLFALYIETTEYWIYLSIVEANVRRHSLREVANSFSADLRWHEGSKPEKSTIAKFKQHVQDFVSSALNPSQHIAGIIPSGRSLRGDDPDSKKLLHQALFGALEAQGSPPELVTFFNYSYPRQEVVARGAARWSSYVKTHGKDFRINPSECKGINAQAKRDKLRARHDEV